MSGDDEDDELIDERTRLRELISNVEALVQGQAKAFEGTRKLSPESARPAMSATVIASPRPPPGQISESRGRIYEVPKLAIGTGSRMGDIEVSDDHSSRSSMSVAEPV